MSTVQADRGYLPLFHSPLVDDDQTGDKEEPQSELDNDNGVHPAQSNVTSVERSNGTATSRNERRLRRFTQATDLELFYDLFFVANLTVFTYVHEVNDSDSLKQYVGFFSILWFTWYQVSLYDVRFAMDSVFERLAKAIQFLVMIGFAITGPEFNVGEQATGDGDSQSPSLAYFRGLTITLMISRLVLSAQYLQSLWFAREYRKMLVPMGIIAATYFIAAMVYLGLFWSFDQSSGVNNHSYIVWYVLAVLETLAVTLVSCVWKSLSYTGTHIVERMSLLTLIILGEGAIAIAKACQYIVYSQAALEFGGSVAAVIVCAVLNLYFMYMLYFDWIREKEEEFNTRTGPVRQLVWSFMHFALHVALVLAVEGASQAITWNAGVRRSTKLLHQVGTFGLITYNGTDNTFSPGNVIDAAFEAAATCLNSTGLRLIERQLDRSTSLSSTAQGAGYLLQLEESAIPTIANGTSLEYNASINALWWTIGVLYATIFKIAGFYPPETIEERAKSLEYLRGEPIDFTKYDPGYWEGQAEENIAGSFRVFKLTFTYFFVASGLFIIVCAILAALNRGHKVQGKRVWVRLGFMGAIGLALALLATMAAPTASTSNLAYYILSPWLLPTVTLCLFAVVVVNCIKMPARLTKENKRKTNGPQA